MRSFIPFLALIFLAGCTNPPIKVEKPATELPATIATAPSIPAASIPDKVVDVWLMPIDGFPPDYAREMEQTFSAELGLNIRTTVHAGRTQQMFGPSQQMISERVRDELRVPLHRLYDVGPKTVIIVLTPDDLNNADSGLRFTFATHLSPEHLSIVSIARLSDSFYGGIDAPAVTKRRLYKMVKKAIGLQYYGYSRKTDLNSVMYSPIMSLDDIDIIGTSF
jgi:predicted Zn-dependent protease